MSKRKAPKFNAVLDDFRKFIGETKEAEEPQGDCVTAAPKATSDKEVADLVPAAKGSTTDPASNAGVEATEKLPGTKQPSTQEPERKEVPASSKVAADSSSDLVNRLLANIKLAADKMDDESETAKERAEEVAEEVAEDKEDKKEEKCEEDKDCDKSASEESAVDTDALAEKIASHYRNISVGYELGKFLFQSLGNKVAADDMPVDPSVAAAAAVPLAEAGASDSNADVQAILEALQELVQEGSITEEQAQQVLMELQAAVQDEAGAAPEVKEAGALFSEEETQVIEGMINSKVAEWVAEGKTDAEITELVKQAAEFDASALSESYTNAAIAADAQEATRKVAALKELGATDEQVQAYFNEAEKQAHEAAAAQEIEAKIDQAVTQKVAELEAAGYSEAQIEEYLKQAAQEDAKLIKQAAEQQEIQDALRAKVAAERQEKLANVPPEVQQILQALESLLQSGEISEEEAMQVLQELGLSGDQMAAAPEGEAPVATEAPAEKAPAKEEKKEEK